MRCYASLKPVLLACCKQMRRAKASRASSKSANRIGIRMNRRATLVTLPVLVLLAAAAFAAHLAAADTIKVGTVRTTGGGPLYVAQERGYFAAEGVPVELVFFDASQPAAVATVAGAIDFGVVSTTGGLYSLAGQGAL